MAKILCAALSVALLSAQSMTLSGPAKVRWGQSAVYQLEFTPGPTSVSGFQFESNLPNWTTSVSGKTSTCDPKTLRCIVIGHDNATPLPAGIVASVSWTPPNPIPANIMVSGIAGTQPDGLPVPVTVGTNIIDLSLTADVNGDRVINMGDVLAMILRVILGPPACTAEDQNGDGQCTIHDVQIVVNEYVKTLGG